MFLKYHHHPDLPQASRLGRYKDVFHNCLHFVVCEHRTALRQHQHSELLYVRVLLRRMDLLTWKIAHAAAYLGSTRLWALSTSISTFTGTVENNTGLAFSVSQPASANFFAQGWHVCMSSNESQNTRPIDRLQKVLLACPRPSSFVATFTVRILLFDLALITGVWN